MQSGTYAQPQEKTVKLSTVISAFIILAVYAAVFVAEQTLPSTSILFTVLKKGATYALVAVSMNLLNGFTGLFSLGQAGFMLIGAYAYGILTIPVEQRANVYQYYNGGIVQFALPVVPALIIAGLVAAAFAFLIGLPVLRLKSDYLAIATLGFAEIIRTIFQWDKLGVLTNGSNLLREYPTFSDFNIRGADGEVTLYLSTLVPFIIAGVCIALIVLLLRSSYGRAFMAIRDDEIAAEAMGINLAKHKQIAFCTSSFFAGIGGAMLAMYQNTVQAKAFTSAMTYEILLIVVIGGIGSVTGSCIGSFLFVACSEWWLRFLDQKQMIGNFEVPLLRNGFRLVVFSIIIMIVVLFFRQGIMGTKELPDLFKPKKGGGKKAAKRSVKEKAEAAKEAVKADNPDAAEAIEEAAQDAAQAMTDGIANVCDAVQAAAQEAAEQAPTTLQEKAEAVKEELKAELAGDIPAAAEADAEEGGEA
ncbi:MAG: branched-chain amino acid ABC transporter permease [Clostridiales bacterium]|nr:branched-chain amino acid ABC transporter permease [Clostridiales bacterium]